ncbi:MAG: hypothetical protein IKP73_03215 [Bacteroidales bacterium]|nr:hypothetical protein [Bacteroidales bacterium]
MNKYFVKIAVVLFLVAFAMSSCDKDGPEVTTPPDDVSVGTVVMEGHTRQPIEIDGKKQEWTFPARQKSLSKGILVDEATLYPLVENNVLKPQYGSDYKLIDTVNFVHNNTNYSIKVLRVDRKSEPGKYFYVMIDNLNVQLDTACWAYADSNSNASTYGRLYTWHAANALAPQITMDLPVYSATNPTEKLMNGDTNPVEAKILSRQDVCDIIECDAIGNMSYNGYTIDDNIYAPPHGTPPLFPLFYYDVFVGGLEYSGYKDYSRGLHTLAGFRNTIQQDPMYWNTWVYGWYTGKNTTAFIWLRNRSGSSNDPFHYPLEIDYDEDYNYTAFINAAHWDQYGFSVRYVFEPTYLSVD